MNRIVVTELEKTCAMCPSQWSGRTDDGRHVYVRYRWGHLQVGFGATPTAAVDDDTISLVLGDSLDGWLDEDELAAATSDRVKWPFTVTVGGN